MRSSPACRHGPRPSGLPRDSGHPLPTPESSIRVRTGRAPPRRSDLRATAPPVWSCAFDLRVRLPSCRAIPCLQGQRKLARTASPSGWQVHQRLCAPAANAHRAAMTLAREGPGRRGRAWGRGALSRFPLLLHAHERRLGRNAWSFWRLREVSPRTEQVGGCD
jgi:hypothetical protein